MNTILRYTKITSYINMLYTVFVVFIFVYCFSFCFLSDLPIFSEAFDLLEKASEDSVVGGFMVLGGIAGLALGFLGVIIMFFLMIFFGILSLLFVPCSIRSFRLLKLQKKNVDFRELISKYKKDAINKLILHYCIIIFFIYLAISAKAFPIIIYAIPSLVVIILSQIVCKKIKLFDSGCL